MTTENTTKHGGGGHPRLRLGWLAAVALVFGTGALDRTEVLCEEAIAHLEDCCGSLNAYNVCGNADGCNPVTTLSQEESACILELSCSPKMRQVCDRVEALSAAVDSEIVGEVQEQEICP